MTKFKAGETYKTRGGLEAKIFAIDYKGKYPIKGAVIKDGGHLLFSWTREGVFQQFGSHISVHDLVPPEPFKYRRWVNFYPHIPPYDYSTREQADKYAKSDRIACVMVEFEEGQGL